MSKTINVADLQRVSIQYDPILKVLPFNELMPRLGAMGFRFLSSDKELREASFERKGAISKPLVAGLSDNEIVNVTELGKAKESKLVPEWGYTALIEDIMNYEDLNIIGNSPENVDPVTKKHPQELLIVSSVVKTTTEDLLDGIYFSERDDEGNSPLDLFDGINHIADTLVSAGEISETKGSLVPTETIATPEDGTDYSAYTIVVNFLRSAPDMLKRGGAILKMTQTTYYNVMDALSNKLNYKGLMGYDMVLNALTGDAGFPGLVISVEPEMGTGDRIYLTKAQNFDFSLWTDASKQFVQVRNPFQNPNAVQYWCQWKAGSRIRNYNAKSFMMNDGTAVGRQLSGDYVS